MKIETQVTLNEAEIFDAIEKYLLAKGFNVNREFKEETFFTGIDPDDLNPASGELIVKVQVKRSAKESSL